VKVVDETGVVRGMRLAYGYAPRCELVYDTAPLVRFKRLNLLGGLDGDGALFAWPYTVNTDVFNHFIETYLLPNLKKGDFVVWDNASFHRDENLLRKLRRRGVTLVRLPRYSPEYNPIEKLWQKLKHYMKKERIDLFCELEAGVVKEMEQIKVSDIEGWYRSCGFKTSMN
jgi:hypothetical protein